MLVIKRNPHHMFITLIYEVHVCCLKNSSDKEMVYSEFSGEWKVEISDNRVFCNNRSMSLNNND